jgi:hypothetical protein
MAAQAVMADPEAVTRGRQLESQGGVSHGFAAVAGVASRCVALGTVDEVGAGMTSIDLDQLAMVTGGQQQQQVQQQQAPDPSQPGQGDQGGGFSGFLAGFDQFLSVANNLLGLAGSFRQLLGSFSGFGGQTQMAQTSQAADGQ